MMIFFHLTAKAKATTEIHKWDYIKLKDLCAAKEIINKMKRQPADWEKIFASHIFAKKLIFKVCKKLIQLNSKEPNNLI